MNQTDKQVAEMLDQWGIRFYAAYIGERTPFDGNQVMDSFRVTIGGYDTDFFSGLGHRRLVKTAPKVSPPYRPGTMAQAEYNAQYLKPVLPTAAAVLSCLLLDADAADQSFADWAAEFGYDTDSRKALATYEACCATGFAMRKVFTAPQREELHAALRDY